MGGLFGGSPQKVSSTAPEVSGLRMQTSARGRAIPLVYGKTRVAANVIWYGDFRAVEHRSRQSAGGKGGGGGSPIETVSYSYEVAVQLALCEGPVRSIGTVWVGKNVGTLGTWNLSQFTGDPGQQPMPYLLSRPALADAALSYRGTAYVGTGLLALGDDPSLPNMSFEVDSTFGLSDSIRDANPADVLADLLGNTRYGLGARADALGDLTALRQWCLAAGLLVSPAYTEQQPARELLSRLLQIAAAGVYYSEGRIKAVPLANSPASGNGVQYSPDLTPAYDLGDDDFLQDGDSDPVQCRRTATADVYNCVRVKFVNRASGYNDETVEAKDPGAIARDGLRLQELDLHELADANVARLVAQLALQRGYVRNRYQFRLGWRFALLEPTDLVTLSDAGLGLTRALVRITEIEEDEDGTLSVQAEEVPIGTVNATRYPTQASNGYAVNHNTPPGAANRPVIFEPPLALAGAPEIWLAASGSSDTWGGCDVWVSDDNATYQRLGRLNGKCRHGVLAAPLPASVGIDTANLLRVDVAAAGGVLLAATQQNADQLVSLCYVDGELLAYRDATLTAPGRYDLGYLVRGAWGTPISSHGTGSAFARLDQSIARFGYDKARVGQTLYIKLQSFNIYGNHTESLAELTAYPYQIKGAALADVTGLALEQPFSGRSCKIRWNAVDGAIAYSVEVWGGSPQALRRSVAVGDTRRYEYSWEDATADGGPWRQISLRVRAISATGVSGNWATVVANNPVPPALTGISVSPGYNAIFFACSQPADLDAAGLRVWLSTVAGFTPADGSLVYDGPDYSTTLYQLRDRTPLQAGTTYYLRAAAFDAFGKDGLQISSEYTITPVSVAGGLKPGDIDAAMVRALDTAKLTGTLKDWQLESINAAKIAGQLVDGQLAALHAAKLVGQLQDPQIAQLSADKLLGKVQLNQLAADVQGPLASAVSTANQALITANHAASATSVSQLSAQVDALSTNLLPVALWKPGMQALPAPWGNNWNDASEQVIITAPGPYGDAATVLKAVAISGQADGGWNISTAVDRTRAYRFCVWIKDVSGNAGSVYLGIDTVCNPAGVPVGNPYFHVHAKSGLANGRWYLFTGYIYPEGATFPAQAQSAIYDGETGTVVATGSDFAWRPGAELTNPRCYQYYADAGAEQWFAYPRFEALDGREPSIADLLAGTALLNAKAAITRVANVEVAVAGKAAASDVTTLQARVAAAEAGISAANQARADGDAASASSINQVNARMAPGGDIYGALAGKAAQVALEATNTRVSTVETLAHGKASASEFQQLNASVTGARREVFVPGDINVFYPVALQAAGRPNASTNTWRVSRPYVHQDGSWAGSYVADITARGSDWGNAPPALISVFQRTGSGLASWGIGKVSPAQTTPHVVLHLRGGLTHTIELMGPPTSIDVTMPGSDGTVLLRSGVESYAKIAQADAPLAIYLNKDWRPDGTLAKESVELLPQALNDISAQNTRLATAEAVLGTKAAATTVEMLQARVNRRKSYRVTTWGNAYDGRYGAENAGFFTSDGVHLAGYNRSYVVVRFNPDGTVATSTAFDVYGAGALFSGGAAEMAGHLNAMPLGTLVLIYTSDEPGNLRLSGGLADAIYRCGGTSAIFASGGGSGFHAHAVYVLMGRISGKQGTAFEAYRGDMPQDPAAYLSLSFDIMNGEFVGISPAATASAGAVLNRIHQVEATVAGKASATDITTLQARVGSAEASVTTLASAQASLDGRVSGKWGVAIEATLPDGRKKLSGLQAFNDGSTASFVISADQLLIQGAGSAINPDPYFQDASCWHTYTGSWGIAKIPDGRAGDYALRSLSRPAEITGARPLPFDPGKNYRVKAWARGLEGANGQLYLGAQLLDSNGNNLSGNGTFWYTTITPLTSVWTECVGFIGPNHALVPPSGAKSFRPIALLNYTGTAGYMELQAYEIEEVLPSTLIQNGAITTDKIAANAILADKIAANSISSSHIVVGSLTGDRLAVNSISGDKIQAGTLTANHIDSRNLTIKDAAGNVIFGAGQSLDVGRITGLGSLATANSVGVSQVSGLGPLATKAQVAASDMAVGSLSAISANLGTVTAGNLSIQSDGAGGWGKLQSGSKWWYDGQNGWVLAREPGGGSLLEFQGGSTLLRMSSWGDCLLRFGDKIEMRGDGFVRVRRIAVAEPDIVASGTQAVSNSWWLGEDYYWSTGSGDNRESGYGERSRTQVILIDTGISVSASWYTAASDIYAATATISSGQSRNGGGTGYGETSIVIGDGLSSGGGGYIDNRVYIKYVYQHVGQPIFISAVDWKLVRI